MFNRLLKFNSNLVDDCRGVTFLEFAIVLPLLVVFLMGALDISRLYAFQAILTKGAEEGLNLALKVPNLDVDLYQSAPSEIDYQRYLQARDLVVRESTSLPLGTLFTDRDTESAAQLIDFVYSDPGSGGPLSESAAILRPGEKLEIGEPSSGDWLYHRTYPSESPPPQPTEVLLESHPVIVQLRASVKTFTPFFPKITISGTASGYREQVPRGPLGGEFGLEEPPAGSTSTTNPPPETVNYTTTTTIPSLCAPDWRTCAQDTGARHCVNFSTPDPGQPCECAFCNPSSNSHIVLF